jgi:hypothetical protein
MSPQFVLEGTCDESWVIRGKEAQKYVEEQLSLNIDKPAIALGLIKGTLPVRDFEVVVKGNGLEKRVKSGKYGWLLLDGLSPGKYEIEFALAYETVEPVNALYVPTNDGKVTKIGDRLWKLTYVFDLERDTYLFKEVRLNLRGGIVRFMIGGRARRANLRFVDRSSSRAGFVGRRCGKLNWESGTTVRAGPSGTTGPGGPEIPLTGTVGPGFYGFGFKKRVSEIKKTRI